MQVKLKYRAMEMFIKAIVNESNKCTAWLQDDYNDEIMLQKSVLDELYVKLAKDFFTAKDVYKFKLKPHQAFAVRICFADVDRLDYFGIILGKICDEAHRVYATKIPVSEVGKIELSTNNDY